MGTIEKYYINSAPDYGYDVLIVGTITPDYGYDRWGFSPDYGYNRLLFKPDYGYDPLVLFLGTIGK